MSLWRRVARWPGPPDIANLLEHDEGSRTVEQVDGANVQRDHADRGEDGITVLHCHPSHCVFVHHHGAKDRQICHV